VERACGSCGRANPPDARFCAHCGVSLAEPEREARKVVTALFCDVVGSTQLAERHDPEDFTAIVGEAVRRMAGVVEEFGGTVSELAGDGLLALFGAPAAHEDDPERAVRAGLAIVERGRAYAEEVAREWALEGFAVRVGVETGLAVLGSLGGGRKVDYTAMGDPINTAARLQAEARPGTVLVGPRTHRAAEALFRWGEPRELELKGKAASVAAREALAALAEPGLGAGLPAVEAPLVGRERELEAAAGVVDGVIDGAGGVLFVLGEAGIGKSRLLRELRERFHSAAPGRERPARWLEGRCVSYGGAVPYLPLRGLLRGWLDREPGADLGRLVGEHAAALEAELLSGAGNGAGAASTAPSPEARQERLHEAMAALMAALAAEGPVVVALDDLHWADPSSVALLERLMPVTEEEAVLLALAARPEREHAVWELRQRAARELPHCTREVALDPLGEEADRALLANLVGAEALPGELERRVLERAEGNPFYLEELVRSLVDSGALVREGPGWRLDERVVVDLPDTIEKVVLARVDRLPPESHEALAAAAVLGRQFPLALLERVAGEDVRGALRELQRLDLVRQAARWPAPEYRFRHSLIQEAAYRALLRRRRQELHRQAAGAIEELFAAELQEHAGELARHHHAAGDYERALDWHERAASAAEHIHAREEALGHITEALAAAAALGLGPENATVRRLYLQRADIHYAVLGDMEAAEADARAALQGARASGDAETETEALVSLAGVLRHSSWPRAMEAQEESVRAAERSGDLRLQAQALGRLAISHANLLQLDRAVEVAADTEALARGRGDPVALIAALDGRKLAAVQLGELGNLDRICTELGGLLRPGTHEDVYYRSWVLLEWAFVPLAAADWATAQERLEEALELNRERASRSHDAMYLDALCWLHRSRGDYARALSAGRAAVERRTAIEEWRAWACASLGWTLLDVEATGPAIEVLEQGRETGWQSQSPGPWLRCTALLAWARARRGELATAQSLAREAGERLASITAPPGRAWVFGAHAYAAAARALVEAGEPRQAQAVLEPVREPAAASGWHEEHARTALVWGRALAADGERGAAEQAMREALDVAERAGLPGTAWRAHGALAALLGDRGHAAAGATIVERLAATLDDDALRSGFRERALADLQAAPAS
jgi:class 3 adenylate cyclase/tetratricopeptide (TPR) repeat protein